MPRGIYIRREKRLSALGRIANVFASVRHFVVDRLIRLGALRPRMPEE